MTKFILHSLVSLVFYLSACAEKPIVSRSESPTAKTTVTSTAIKPGDHPDPSVIRVNGTYWAVATTSAWAPAFTLMSSEDLTTWQVRSAVFQKVPAWSDGNYWAPEIVQMDGIYFVYYTAKNKKSKRLCVAVAKAHRPEGPYKDHGPLVCEKVGSIDAATVIDETGQKFLLWKEDGNSQKKPTPIHLQRLSKDGTKLIGTKTATITNDVPWEKNLVEAPFVLKRNDFWYMFYAGSDCCGRECKYAVGVARAKTLLGPWEKNPANPIVASNDLWKCPGHGSVVTNEKGQDIFVYHAYHAKDFNDVGRQMLADGIDWDSKTGWPTINQGLGAGLNFSKIISAAKPSQKRASYEDFSGMLLSPEWLWPYNRPPQYRLDAKNKQLTLIDKNNDAAFVSAVLAKMTFSGDYVTTAVLDRSQQTKSTTAGLAAIGNLDNVIALTYQGGSLILQQIRDKTRTLLATMPLPERLGAKVHLRLTARSGHFFQFSYSLDGRQWNNIGSEIDGGFLPPWDLGIRNALVAGSGSAVFNSFHMEANHMESKVNSWK